MTSEERIQARKNDFKEKYIDYILLSILYGDESELVRGDT